MNLKQPFGPKLRLPGLAPARVEEVSPPKPVRKPRRQVEELKVQVLELAEHQMEISIRILRKWITE
ncbi:MAG: hypothetical protein RR317_00550 [Bilophila sp.]